MRNFFLTSLTCAVICLLIPVNQVQSQSGYKPTVKESKPVPKPASLVADSTGSGFIVIDSAGYEQGTYVLQLDLREDGWALKTLTAVNLSGQPARPVPVPDDPEPEPKPEPPDNETLAAIQAEFEALGKLDAFEQQLELMRQALALQDNMADIAAMHAWVQRGFEFALQNNADLWAPWTDWFNQGADETETAEDYRTWVDLAKESLK